MLYFYDSIMTLRKALIQEVPAALRMRLKATIGRVGQ